MISKMIALKRHGYISEIVKVPSDTRVFYKSQYEEYRPNQKKTIRGYKVFELKENDNE